MVETQREQSGSATLAPNMVWDAWGVAAGHQPLSAQIRGLLAQVFGISGEPVTRRDENEVPLIPTTLTDADRAGLTGIVGDEYLTTDDIDRLRHAGGKSTPTCCAAARAHRRTPPTPSSSPPTTHRSSRCSGTAPNTASRSSRSVAEPAWSAAWIRCADSSTP